MERERCVALLAAAVLGVLPCRARAQAQPDQSEIARLLLSSNLQERSHALDVAWTVPPAKVVPELRASLITLLERENALVAGVTRRGEIIADFEDPDFIASLSRLVAGLEEPRAISALSRAIYGGLVAARALARFGDHAVPAVVGVATSPESHYDLVNHGLVTLRLMVEGKQDRPLSGESLQAVKRVAKARLTGPQYFVTLWHAIDLAMALDDPELSGHVSALASDHREAIARGINDPDLIARTQQRACERLAGISAVPKREVPRATSCPSGVSAVFSKRRFHVSP